jgi:UDP-glucose 4-epimerase
MSRIFIDGGAGFIGYHTCKALLEKNHEITIYDSFVNYINPLESHYPFYLQYRLNHLKNKVKIVRGDIRNRGCLVKALQEAKPEIVIHLAAIPLATVSNQFSEEATQVNLNGTITVLESIRAVGCVKRFIYTSSSFVYGNFQYAPADEQHPTNPIDLYGGTKLCGETLTKVFGQRFGIEYVIIRPSAVYGPTDCNRRVSQIFVENAIKGKPLIMDNGGVGMVDFTYVEDTAQGLIHAAFSRNAKDETFNITRGEGRSALDFAEVIKKHIPSVGMEIKDSNEVRPNRGALNIVKAKKLFGYRPKFPIEKGIPKYIKFVKECGVVL